MNFQSTLYQQIENLQIWTPELARYNHWINTSSGTHPASAVLEQCTRAYLGIGPSCPVPDWNNIQLPAGKEAINWTQILAFIQEVLTILGPILGGL